MGPSLEGPRLIGGQPGLSPADRIRAREELHLEVVDNVPGEHPEISILNAADQTTTERGPLTIDEIYSVFEICPGCRTKIEERGGGISPDGHRATFGAQ